MVEIGYDTKLTKRDAPITLLLDADDSFQAHSSYLKDYSQACVETKRCKGIFIR